MLAGAKHNISDRDMIRIWGRPTSICTMRVMWALVEVGVEFELTLASGTMGPEGHVSRGGEPFGSVDETWYRAMNPNGTIPVIDDGGFVLWESNAIVAWLANRYGAGTLLDGRSETLARALQWMSWTNEHLEPPLHTQIMEFHRLPEDQRTPGAADEAGESIARTVEALEAQLARTDYVAGERFSMGDIPPGAAVYRWRVFGEWGGGVPRVDAWLARLREREGFRRHVAPPELHV